MGQRHVELESKVQKEVCIYIYIICATKNKTATIRSCSRFFFETSVGEFTFGVLQWHLKKRSTPSLASNHNFRHQRDIVQILGRREEDKAEGLEKKKAPKFLYLIRRRNCRFHRQERYLVLGETSGRRDDIGRLSVSFQKTMPPFAFCHDFQKCKNKRGQQ